MTGNTDKIVKPLVFYYAEAPKSEPLVFYHDEPAKPTLMVSPPQPFPYKDDHKVPWKYDASFVVVGETKHKVMEELVGLQGMVDVTP